VTDAPRAHLFPATIVPTLCFRFYMYMYNGSHSNGLYAYTVPHSPSWVRSKTRLYSYLMMYRLRCARVELGIPFMVGEVEVTRIKTAKAYFKAFNSQEFEQAFYKRLYPTSKGYPYDRPQSAL
jgi:hypothetical protein